MEIPEIKARLIILTVLAWKIMGKECQRLMPKECHWIHAQRVPL